MNTEQFLTAVSIKTIEETENAGLFEIEGLYTGYGLTLGNALRRVLLSSIPGAAITKVKIKGVGHEFTTIEHVMEDVVEIALNLKKVRFQFYGDETQLLTLHVKGEKVVTAGDIEENANAMVINKDLHIATITTKGGEVDMELTVERGLGYVPVEAQKTEKLQIGVIALDAFFSPIQKVSFTVENMRVADRTDYNRVRIAIDTDGSITPSAALKQSCDILRGHFEKASTLEVKAGSNPAPEPQEEKKAKRKKKEE